VISSARDPADVRCHARTENEVNGISLLSMTRAMPRLRMRQLLLLALVSGACDSTGSPSAVTGPGDTNTPPQVAPDTAHGDSTTPGPRPDSIPAPSDSTLPPSDSISPPSPPDSSGQPPPVPLSHVGVSFGPAHLPPELFAQFSGTIYTATDPVDLLAALEAARRANMRLFIDFTGNEQFNRDSNGFSFAKWKQRVDRFLGVDLTPYIADGTILAHFILDEPSDPSNWNGKRVPQAEVEAMAQYSKQIWPTMATMVRGRTDYLVGYEYPHLDALRVQYVHRIGPIADFIAASTQAARSLGLALVGGLNALNGGSPESGIPGRRAGKFAMSADELRTWGRAFLTEPSLCAFVLYEYDSTYFARPDIQAAVSELSQLARSLPARTCRP
jgi:hypothetical protein